MASQLNSATVLTNTVLRQAVASDAETIAALHTESWRKSYQGILPDDFLAGPIPEQHEQEWFKKLNPINKNNIFVRLAEQDNVLVAFACVVLDKEPARGLSLIISMFNLT
jgi:hypothetical protein